MLNDIVTFTVNCEALNLKKFKLITLGYIKNNRIFQDNKFI